MNSLMKPKAVGLPFVQGEKQTTPLGTAQWQEPGEEHRYETGDLWVGHSPTGMPVGLRDDRHVLLVSGARGGKGASIIVPNLCAWPGSVVVIDPKGENATVTARRRGNGSPYARGMGQIVHILDPYREVGTEECDFAEYRRCFNPLDMLRTDDPEAVAIAGRIADSLTQVESSKDPHWEESARTLDRDVTLFVASSPEFKPEERNLVTVRRLLRAGDFKRKGLAELLDDATFVSGYELLFKAMQKSDAFDGVVAEGGAHWLDQFREAPRAFASVASVACRGLDFLDDGRMRECVSRSDFKLSDLKTDPKGMSLYLCLPQRFLETQYGWLRMMATLVIGEMERVKAKPKSGHSLLMVMDEFPALKRMRVIENAAAQIAGFGVKMMFVAQTLAQLKDVYRDNWETLVANAGTKLFFGNDDQFTRDYASKLAGDIETMRESGSASETRGRTDSRSASMTNGQSDSTTFGMSSGGSMGPKGGSGSHNMSYSHTSGYSSSASVTHGVNESHSQTAGKSETFHRRMLITPDEVGRLFSDPAVPRVLVLRSGWNPMALFHEFYFRERRWRGFYDRHWDFPAPITLEALPALEAKERAEAETARREAVAASKRERLRREAREQDERVRATERARQDAVRREQEKLRAEEEARRRHRQEFIDGVWSHMEDMFPAYLGIALLIAVLSIPAYIALDFIW